MCNYGVRFVMVIVLKPLKYEYKKAGRKEIMLHFKKKETISLQPVSFQTCIQCNAA